MLMIRALHCLRCSRKTDRGLAIARMFCASVILLLFVAPSFVFGQGRLTGVTVAPSNPVAGAGTIYTINFTSSATGVIPIDGKIRLTFPAGFDVANVSLAQNISGLNGGYADVTPAGQVVTLTRDGFGASLPELTDASFRIAVVNNSTLAAGFRIFVETLTNADAPIDTATSALFNIAPGPVQRFTFDPVSTVTAGVPFNLTIRAKDIYGNTVTSFTGTLSLLDNTNTLTPPTAVISSTGTATVSNATITKAQTGVLITAVSGGLSGTSNAFTVVHSPLDHFAVTSTSGIIGSQVAGAPFNIRLVAQDVYDNTVTAFTSNVTLSNTTSSITPTISGNFSSGILASQSVTINKIASADLITASGGEPIKTGSSNGFFVGSGNLAGFQIDPVPSPQTAGVPIPVKVTALDANGNTATDFTGTVNFSLNSGSLAPVVSGNFVAGVWNGNVTVLASGTGKIINVTDGTFSTTSNAFEVNSGTAISFAVTNASEGTISTQTAGTNFSIKITAKDANGNVATGFAGAVELGDNTGTLTPGAATITTGGAVTVDVNITRAQAIVSITAKSGSLTGASNVFTVNSAALDHFLVTNTSNGSIGAQQAGTPFNIKIVARDFFNNSVTSFNGTVAFSNTTNSISPLTSGSFTNGVLASQSVTITKTSAADVITVNGGGASAVSNSFLVNAGNLAGFMLSAIPSPQTAGVPFPLTITAVDANQNTVTGFAGTVSFNINSGAVTPLNSSNFVAGVWNGNVTVPASGSGKIITVTDGVRQTSSNAFNVDPGGLDHFVIPLIGSQAAGRNFTVTVTAKDANNNNVSHTGIVTLSDNTGTLTASSLVFSGQATQAATDVKIKKAKSDAVITANGSGKSGSSNTFAVNTEAGTLDHFAVTNTSGDNINSPQTAGAVFNIKIVAQDQFDNTVTDFNETVMITDLGTLNLTSANFVNGELASQSVTINQARLDNQLMVTGGSPARTGASNLFNVIAGGLAGFTIDPISDQATNEPFSITIRARDANGNLATSFNGTVTISDLTNTITPTASLPFINGVRNESVKISQTRTGDVITVSSGSASGNSNPFNITAVTVDHFVINTIGNQTAGQPFPITITARDASNNPVTAFNGTVTVSDLSGSITPVTSNPFINGTLTQNFTITKSFTNDQITVTGLGKSNTSNPFNVIAGNLHHFAIATIPNQAAGVSFPITITAQDVNNNTVTGFGGAVTIAINSGSITPAISGAFASGVRVESVAVPAVGNNRIITVSDGSGHTGASNAFNVVAGGLDHFVFSPIATQAAGAPFSLTITAKDANNNDVSFNGSVALTDNTTTLTPASVAMNGVSVTVNNAQITLAQTGVVITATGGGKNGASLPFTVQPGALSRVRIVEGTGGGPGTEFTTHNMTADDQLPLHAAGYDAHGNYISDPPVNWVMQAVPPSVPPLGVVSPATSSSFTTFSANKVGTLKIIADHATASVVDDTTGNITIATGVPNSVRVLQTAFGNTPPVGNVTLNSGDPLPMHASSFDADGNRIGDVSVTWRVNGNIGFVSPTSGTNTTFTATTAGTGTVTADHATLNDGSTGTITVNTNTLSFIRIMDSANGNTTQVGNRTVRTDETLPVHAAGFDASGNYLGDVNVTWSITGSIGTLSSSFGISTTFDPKTPGTGVITATHSTAGNASTGTITVILGPDHHIKILKDLSGPTEEATSDSLFTGETRDFHASSFDIDDNWKADVSVTWNVSSGIGSLNPSSGASTTLTASTVGSGVITAQHATLGNDQTGVIKVKAGNLSYVRVVEGPTGDGQKLGAISRNTDQEVTVHAAGYDANNNYLGDQPVTWSVIGVNIGTLDNLNGTSTTLTLRTPGVGRIVADHVSASDDTSGAITVSVGALHHVKVLTGDQNLTAVVADHSMNADETFVVHAGGYDADDNYRGDEPVNWTVTGGIGTLTPTNGISTTLNARKVGNGQIKADHANPAVIDGLTGTITVTPGALAFIKVIEGPTGGGTELGTKTITADEVLQLHAAGFDADSNYVGDQPANWSSAGNLAPVVTGANVSSIAFAPTLSPATGTIRATHATAGFDDTGLITVNDGALRKIKILADPSGETTEVGATTLASGQPLEVHAAGFDADDNYISDLSANWSVVGAIGTVAPASGISTIFTAGASGTGSIRATAAGNLEDVAGPITVIPGGVAKIILRTAPNGGGAPFNNLNMTADQEATVYAAGYDVGNTFLGDVNVTWTSTGNLTPAVSATGSSVTFSPTLANADGSVNGLIIGEYSPSIKDSTGTITVLPGNPSGTVNLIATPSGLPSDGASTSTITTTSTIKDADGNDVGAGKRFTVTLAPGNLGTITTPDLDPGTPDVQIETNASSQLSFVFQAGTTGGIVNVNVVSLSGATGSTPISLGSISILSVNTSPTTVSRGQTGISVSMLVQNVSSVALTEVTAGLTFTGSTDRTGEYTVTPSPSNPTTLAGNSTATFSFIVNVGANATLETVTLNGTVSGKVNGTPVSASNANQTDAWTVQLPAALSVTSVTAAPDTVAQGQTGIEVRVRVANNLGQTTSANAVIDSVRLVFKQGALIKTSDYIIGSPTGPGSIAGNAEVEYTFLVNVGSAATLGLITIDASAYGKEGNTGSLLTDTEAGAPDTWRVIEGNVFTIVTITPSQSTVTAGMTKPWQVRMELNNAGSSPIQLNLAPDKTFIRFIIGSQNVTSQFGITSPTALDEGGTVLAAGNSGHLTFGITPTGSTPGTATISGFAEGRDQAGQTVTDNTNDFGTGAVTVQSPGTMKIDRIDVSQSPVTANRGKDWIITATVTNEGESAVRLDSMNITVGNNIGYLFIKPSTFKDGTSVLGTRETKLLDVVVDQTGSQTGAALPIAVTLKGTETNSGRLVTSTGVNGSINVQSQAVLEITSVTPSRPSVTTNQAAAWNVTVAVRNNGGSQAVVKSDSSTNLRFRIGTQFQSGYTVTLQSAPTIGAGQTANLVFQVTTTGPNPGAAALWVKVAATETNSDAEVIDTDNSSSVLVQSPPSVSYIANGMQPDIVNIGSSYAFKVRVRNAASAATVALNPANTRFLFSGGPANFVATLDANFVQNIPSGDTTLTFVSAQIPASMPPGTYQPVVELRGTENGNSFSRDLPVTNDLRVTAAAQVAIVSVQPSQSTVTAGMTKPWNVVVRVANNGGFQVRLDSVSLQLINGIDRRSEYDIVYPSQFLGSASPFLATGATDSLRFDFNRTGATTGPTALTVRLFVTDLSSNQQITPPPLGNTSFIVQSPAVIRVTGISTSQPTVTANRTTDWTITATVTNEGGSTIRLHPALDSLKVTIDNDLSYIYVKPTMFTDGTNLLGGGQTKSLAITVDQTGSQTGILPIRVDLKGIETNSDRLVVSTGVSGSINVQGQAVLEILSVTPSRPTVTINQTAAWTVTAAVRNNGGSQVTVASDTSTNLRFRIAGQFQNGYDVTQQSAPTIGAGATANVIFRVNTTGPNPGTAELWVKVAAIETNSDTTLTVTDNNARVLVQSPSSVTYIPNSMQPDIVNIGTFYTFTVRVNNAAGAATVALNPAATTLSFSGGPATFTATLDANPGKVQSIASGDTTLTFVSTQIPTNMPEGTYTPVVELRGTANGNPFNDSFSVTPNELQVALPAQVAIVSVQPSQSTVTERMTKQWNIKAAVTNNGGFSVRLDSVKLRLFSGNDVTSEYTFSEPTAFVSGNTTLAAGATDTLRIDINVTGSKLGNTTAQVRLFVTDQSNNLPIIPAPEGTTDFLVQSQAALRIISITPSQPTVTRNQTQQWHIDMRVTNLGQSEVDVNFNNSVTGVTLGFSAGYTIQQPTTFLSGSTRLLGSATDTLRFRITATGSQTGLNTIHGRIAGTERNSGAPRSDDTNDNGSGQVLVQAPAQLRIDTVRVVGAPNAPFVNLSQPFGVRVVVRNLGEETADSVRVRLVTDGNSQIIPLNGAPAFNIGNGLAVATTFSITADDVENLSGEKFQALITGATAHNTGASITPQTALDDTAVVIIQRPANLVIEKVVASRDTVSAGQTDDWFVYAVVRNSGAATMTLNTPDRNQLRIAIDGAQQTDYGIEVDPVLLQNGNLTLTGGESDTLRFTVTSTGLSSGAASLIVSLGAVDRNDLKPVSAPGTGQIYVRTTATVRLVQTDPVVLRPLINGTAFVNVDQVFSVKLTVENTGFEDVKDVVVRLQTDGPSRILTPEQTISSIIARDQQEISFSVEADTAAVAGTPPEIFTARVASALTVQGNQPATILASLDSTAQVVVQRPARLSVAASIQNNELKLSTNQSFDFSALITNSGQAPVDGSGLVRFIHPPEFTIVTGAEVRSFTVGQLVTWQVRAPLTPTNAADLRVQITKAAVDSNSQTLALLGKDADTLTVQVFHADLRIVSLEITSPPGAKDRILSTEQEFDFTARLSYNVIREPQIHLRVPAGYDTLSATPFGETVTWRVKATATANAIPVYLVVTASGKDGNGDPIPPVTDPPVTDSLSVTTMNKASLSLSAEISDPPGARDRVVSRGQEFTVTARVLNDGTAGVQGTARLKIEYDPAQGFSTGEPDEKDVNVGSSVQWKFTTPSQAANDIFIVKYIDVPADTNTNASAALTDNRSQVRFDVRTDSVESELRLVSFKVIFPGGATDNGLSTGQLFYVRAQVLGVRANQVTVKLTEPLGFFTNDNTQQVFPGELNEQRDVNWTFQAPLASRLDSMVVTVSGNDANDNSRALPTVRRSFTLSVVEQARLSVSGEISSPLSARADGIVTRNQLFTVTARVANLGAASLAAGSRALLELTLPRDASIPLADDYSTTSILQQEITDFVNGVATWEIKARSIASTQIDNIRVRLLQPYPKDENTDFTATIEDVEDLIPIQTETKTLVVQMLPHTSAGPVAQGEKSSVMMRLKLTNQGNLNSTNILLRGFTLFVRDRNDAPLNANGVIKALRVVDTHRSAQELGSLTSIPATDSLKIPFAPADTLLGGVPDSVDVVVDIADNNASGSVFRLTFMKEADVDAIDQDSPLDGKVEIIFLDERGNNLDAAQVTSQKRVINTANFEKSFYNYPNPFSPNRDIAKNGKPGTTFYYSSSQSVDIELRIYTLLGELVYERSFKANDPEGRSNYLSWNGYNGNGDPVLNGVYIAILKTSAGTTTTKVAVVK
ncbi:hypothetical protein L0337_14325 [candidate division KSB1 bacterium]|nr:hypothetical protein [candidate division KSB1 bacterium]